MLNKLPPLLALILISCAAHQANEGQMRASTEGTEIRYISLDHSRVMVFSGHTARSGGLEAFAIPPPTLPNQPSPMRAFRTADNVQCVSVGPSGNTIEFALRKPILTGDSYTCLGSSFQVTHCTEDCRSAIIRVEQGRGPDLDPFSTQMYIDSCRGLLIWSDTGDLTQSVPLNAFLLQDAVGILADPSYPACNWY